MPAVVERTQTRRLLALVLTTILLLSVFAHIPFIRLAAAGNQAGNVEIVGTIGVAGNQPVEDIKLRAQNASAGTFTTSTNSQGEFALSVEPNVTYGVTFDQEPRGYPIDGVSDGGVIGRIPVGDESVNLGTQTLDTAHRLNVTVVDESGTPVKDAQVTLILSEGDASTVLTNTSGTTRAGEFVLGGSFGAEVNGSVIIKAAPPGDELTTNRTTINVTRDRDVRIVLERAAIDISGIVENPDGSPVTTGRVELTNTSTATRNTSALNASGGFSVTIEPNLTYESTFTQRPAGYPLDGVVDIKPGPVLDVGTTDVSLGIQTLPTPHRLNITVVDGSGTPVEGASVSVVKSAENSDAKAVVFDQTGPDGQFSPGGTVGTETNGTVQVDVDPPAGSVFFGNETTVEVTRDRDVRIVLKRGVTVTGRLKLPDESPLVGDLVTFHDGQTLIQADLTNETGAFSVLVPANQTSTVRFVDINQSGNTEPPRNGIPDLYVIGEMSPGNDTDLGDITLPRGHVVDVQVENTAGEPIRNATIKLFSPRTGGRVLFPGFALPTDDEGRLRLESQPASGIELTGEVGIRVNFTTAEGTFQRATVAQNFTVTNDTTVTVTATRVLVVDPDDPAAYDTIQAAVDAAPAGSVIRIRPRTYQETVRIDKPLTLLGRPGSPAPGPASTAPILTGDGRNASGIIIEDNVSDVTIAGVEIRNYSYHDGRGGRGITAHGTGHSNILIRDTHIHDIGWTAIVEATSGTTVRNWTVSRNVIDDFATFGIRLANVERATVTDNTVIGTGGWPEWNGRTTSNVGILIEAKLRNGNVTEVSSVQVTNNNVEGNLRAGISVNAWNTLTAGSSILRDVAVRSNTVTSENVTFGIGMGAMGHDAAVQDGQIQTNTVSTNGTGIRVWTLQNASAAVVEVESNLVRNASVGMSVIRHTTTGRVQITENRLVDNQNGVVIAANGSATNTTVTENTIADNTQYGVANNGTGTLNATYNWWGASDGPSGAFNGSGDAIRGNVTVQPFYLDAERTQLSEPADFSVAIDSTTAPVTEGEVIEITATVTNTGDVTGTRTITFTTGETERDATAVTLAPGASERVVLSWATNDGDAGEYTATVAAGDDAATTTVSVDAFVPDPEPTPGITLDATAPASISGGANATITYTVENTGDTTLDSVTVESVADTAGLSIVTNGTVQFDNLQPGETARATITVRGATTVRGDQRVSATATAVSSGVTVRSTTTASIVLTQSVQVESIRVIPPRAVENQTVTRTVPFRISKVSDDGGVDTITVQFPTTISNLSVDRVSVRDASGDDVAIAAVTATGSTLTIEVVPDSDAEVRTLAGQLTVVFTTPTVTADTTGNVTLTISDSETGQDRATATFETRNLNASTVPPVIGASDAPPTDPDNDGVYEDVNGDGEVLPGDATVLFEAWFDRAPGVMNYSAQFDLNSDGEVLPGDATVLFREALGLGRNEDASA